MCVPHRRGQLCGECEDGYTHSENFKCGKCSHSGLLLYLIAEFMALIILFFVIMIMKLKMTTGMMQSLLLFAQTMPLISYIPSFVPMSPTNNTFFRIHRFIFGFLNLDFFNLDPFSYCQWSGATVFDNLAFRYVTTFFAIFLLAILVLAVKYCPNKTGVTCTKIADMIKVSNTWIIHIISTLLILPYTQYTLVSFHILSCLTISGEGKVTVRSVVRLQGSVDYFGVDHLPYAIPAVLVLLFLSLPPYLIPTTMENQSQV